MKIKISTILVIFCSIANICLGCCPDDKPGCTLDCWEKCFAKPFDNDPKYVEAYHNIYQVAIGIRNLHPPCKEQQGTAYLLDMAVPVPGSFGGLLYKLQTNLASIIAVAQPVKKDCNPFCMNKYLNHGALYPANSKLSCMDGCQAASFLSSADTQYSVYQTGTTWNGAAQGLADYCFKRDSCATQCSKNPKLLVFFPNSKNSATPPDFCKNNPNYKCAVVGASYGPILDNAQSWANSANIYQVKADKYHGIAADKILSCMKQNCCSKRAKRGPSIKTLKNYHVATLDETTNGLKYNLESGTEEDIVQKIYFKRPPFVPDPTPKVATGKPTPYAKVATPKYVSGKPSG